ncbi:MAG: hypothetical protein ABIK32_07030 [Chloroflexota bacterium]|nr:hypothetical protein [Chloroflexota bacterium]
MGLTAIILGVIGVLCAVVGIVTAAAVIPPVMPEFTWIFWFALSGLFILGAITFSVSRGYYE